MKIGVLAPWNSRFSKSLMTGLEEIAPGRVFLIDSSLDCVSITFDGQSLTYDPLSFDCFEGQIIKKEGWRGRILDLGCLDRVLVHGFSYVNPVLPEADDNLDWSVWQYGHLCQQQKFSALFSLLREMERRGVSVWNASSVYVDHFMKFALLEKIRAAGFLVPALVCLNDVDHAAEFLKNKERVVWRPGTGRGAWHLFGAKQLANRVHPTKPPILLADVEPGSLIRGFILGTRLVFCLQFQAPEFTPPTERLERLWSVPVGPFQSALEKMAREFGIQWGMVVFVDGQDGPWIYDVDPDPSLDWLPASWRDLLIKALACTLIGQDVVPLTEEGLRLGVVERPNLFLRRMLGVLFEMESSKNLT